MRQIYDAIGMTIVRLDEIIKAGFIEDINNLSNLYYTSVIIEVLIHLNFLLQEITANNKKKEISFTDDIPEHKGKRDDCYNNATTLIRFFRNAACHANTSKRQTPNKRQIIAFVYQYGRKQKRLSGTPHLCRYDDDIAVLMGLHVLYVRRHILRAYKEAYALLGNWPELHLYYIFIENPAHGGSIV